MCICIRIYIYNQIMIAAMILIMISHARNEKQHLLSMVSTIVLMSITITYNECYATYSNSENDNATQYYVHIFIYI